MKLSKHLIGQLFLSHLAVAVFSLIAVAWLAIQGFEKFYYSQIAEQLEIRAKLVETQISHLVDLGSTPSLTALINHLGKQVHTRLTVIAASGKVLADSSEDAGNMENHAERPEIMMADGIKPGMSRRYSYTLHKDMMYVALNYRSHNREHYYIRTALPLTRLEERFSDHTYQFILGGVVIGLLSAGLSWLISRKINQPLKTMTDGAIRFAHGDFSLKLPVSSTREMATLAKSMNLMANQLDERIKTINRQKQEQTAMLAAMKEGVIAVDNEELVLYMNPSACNLFDTDPKDAVGQKFQALIRKSELVHFMQDILKKKMTLEAELIMYKHGERVILTSGTPLLDEQDKVIGALLVLNDMTRQKQLENIRREFVANVSHELKTPITLIQGFVETLIDGAINNKRDANKFLDSILNNSKRLNLIIEDLLNLSRIEQIEESALEMTPLDLKEFLEKTILQYHPARRTEKLVLEVHCDDGIKLLANVTMLEQVLMNLIDNAVKYSQTTKPIQINGTEEANEIRIEIKDFGVGIEKEHLPRLFERFYRIDKSRSRHGGGTGLGLAIVKHIVQAHKGRIDVKSEVNQGTGFIIHLPKLKQTL